MSGKMNAQNDNRQFEKLLKLLTLKRFERPPAGYFDTFSARVIERIDRINNPQEEATESPLLRFWRLLFSRPAFASAFALILITGVIAVMRPSQTSDIPLRPGMSQNNPWELHPHNKQANGIDNFPGIASGETREHSSTNPITSSSGGPSLFNQIPTLVNPTPASYAPRQ